MEPVIADVVIVGGGVAGLAAACALRLAGASVVVLERRTEGGDPNRGDLLRPGVVAQLEKWGVGLDSRTPLRLRELRVELDGRAVARRTLRDSANALAIPNLQLEAALRERAKLLGADVRLGWQLQALLTNAAGRVSGLTAVTDRSGAEFQAKVVVGADGRSSAVRDKLGLRLRRTDATHAVLALEAELPTMPRPFPQDLVAFQIGSNGGGFTIPLPGGKRVRIVAVTPSGVAESLARGPTEALVPVLVERGLVPVGSRVDPLRVRAYDLTGTAHALNYAMNGVVCLGDAAHVAPIPSTEGMQMCLLDAECLGRHLGPALAKGEKTINRALDRFERERWPDNEQRVQLARKAIAWLLPLQKGRLTYARSPLGPLALKALIPAK